MVKKYSRRDLFKRATQVVGVVGFGDLLAGCGGIEKEYVYATVLEEGGSIIGGKNSVECSEGSIFGNDSVKIGSTYSVKLKTDDNKIYTFGVEKDRFERSYARLEALALGIEKGTRVKILKKSFNSRLRGTVGVLYDYQIEVLPDKKE